MDDWEKYQPLWKTTPPPEPAVEMKPLPPLRRRDEDREDGRNIEFSMVATPFNPQGGVDE